MPDIEATAKDLENSEEFENILDDWGPQDARALIDQLKEQGWEPVEPGSYCSVALVHGAVRKAGITLDIIASQLMGPFVSVTRYTYSAA